uniref:Prefoldin subunit 3 n=2 Tax=Mucochytrium quahogii TaxID=96639 RepID=A0A7S2W9X8_9STRA|mmetsp:Transcript_4594/g.6847  ORF Transcript_4594/g.6847 Transcript_4594/m.6847 type:complete len:198 (-) Transcript_4594:36-629(-)|eukprot:CAMPEP_0203784640 /NCGR_PEP_ID=MMETSP0100_2-20121128/575_1 /ASSEMBLY_ACC=CAM_ASM_000210 /TAXON_ID=96639 /ORGANISM=" , Strain NY0313808BC1" /LENGTH=197 /DNA_ID=CAMNT_0050686637 /DNA_START=174 /DNA_END=767 /DNA_ORIENTATION=-
MSTGTKYPEYPFGVLSGRNERGIPIVQFVEDLPTFMKQDNATTKGVIEVLQEVRKELGQVEANLSRYKELHKATIPDIKETLEVVHFMRKKGESSDQPVTTSYQVSASIFAEATIEPSKGMVVLWLGANTAAELTFDEAEALLTKNLEKKKEQLAQNIEDLNFVKAQVTVCEVSIARVYNNDVKERRKKAAEEDDSK